MARASRTINPLHFEDLEPHRFEDLVRQLAHGFRQWRSLEATGRLGRDNGLDIRGTELVTAPPGQDLDLVDLNQEDVEDELTPQVVAERSWRIQCKRYKEIRPKLIRDIVAETIPDQTEPPYGIVVAAACDVSAETMASFREESFNRGAQEAYLWTKAHLEDLLFRPENDHLLFAYFDISLSIRRRSESQAVREAVAFKRKLLRAFKASSITDPIDADVVIRAIDDRAYPRFQEVPNFRNLRAAPWHFGRVRFLALYGLLIERFQCPGWVKPDGTWDLQESSRRVAVDVAARYWRQMGDEEHRADVEQGAQDWELQQRIPRNEQQFIQELWLLPYDYVVEIDPIGNALCPAPHIYCRFSGADGPYEGKARFFYHRSYTGVVELKPEQRTALYTSLTDSAPPEESNIEPRPAQSPQ